jgi:cytochrome d ubiquinol oxidase subunit I
MNDAALHAARVFMGDSLGFHIIFVAFGLTLPILVSWMEWTGILKNKPELINLAKFWSKIMALLVITGVISGTIIALQMSLVWTGILKFGGEVIGLPFMFETYAFLIEAVFLALYMTTWNNKKVKPKLHAVFGLFVVLGSTLSAYAITSVNGWMNYPTGFELVNGKLVNISVASAMFSRTALVEFIHSMPAYYFAVCLTIAGIYSFKVLKTKKKDRLAKKHALDWFIIKRLMYLACTLLVVIVITADITGKYLAKYEPVKLAAIELVQESGTNMPFILGGVAMADGRIMAPYVEIPGLLSILAGNSLNTKVVGLNEFPIHERPPLYIHTIFDVKLLLVGLVSTIVISFVIIARFFKRKLSSSALLFSIGISGLIAFTIIELGWMLTEIGRQPWAVRGYIKTAEAFTKTNDITTFGYLFPLAYLALFILTILAILKIIQLENKKKGQ